MKKFLLSVILLLAAAGAALPWINGMVMENLVRGAMDQANQMYQDTGTDIRFELVSYDRGYAGTRAEWKVDLGSFEPFYGVREVVFTETASHGWTAITSETSMEKNPWFAKWVKESRKGKNPLAIRTRYSAFDPITTRITLDAFTLETGGKSINIGALDLGLTLDKSFERASSSGTWQGISEDDQNRLGQVSIESEMEKMTGLVWQGRVKAVLDTVAADDPNGAFQLSHLVFTTEVTGDKDAGQMDVATKMTARDVMVNGKSLSAWSLGLAARNIDVQAYEDLYRLYGEMIGQIAPVLSDPDLAQEDLERVLGAAMIQNQAGLVSGFEKLLKKGFTLEISPVDLTLPQGQIRGHLSLGLLKDMTLAGFFPVAARPDLILEIFSLDSEISLPAEFQRMQPNLTAPMFHGMKTGLFVLKDDRLLHQSQTRDKVLYVNGEVVDLAL